MDVILIGDAARALGVSNARLLQAERRGEIPRPAGKTSRGWRIYTEDDMRVLRQWRASVATREARREERRRAKEGGAQAA